MASVPIVLDFTLCQGTFRLEIQERFDARAVAVCGPSGAGKTTLLEAVAGLRRPITGEITIGRRTLFNYTHGTDIAPRFRKIGYIPQDVALFPHLSVHRNITYGSAHGNVSTDNVVQLFEISKLLDRSVTQLSGGERQRVAIARALMSDPELLLFDEPLTAIDVALRERVLPYIERVRDELALPMIYVSHAEDEVRRIADRVIVLDNGRVVETS